MSSLPKSIKARVVARTDPRHQLFCCVPTASPLPQCAPPHGSCSRVADATAATVFVHMPRSNSKNKRKRPRSPGGDGPTPRVTRARRRAASHAQGASSHAQGGAPPRAPVAARTRAAARSRVPPRARHAAARAGRTSDASIDMPITRARVASNRQSHTGAAARGAGRESPSDGGATSNMFNGKRSPSAWPGHGRRSEASAVTRVNTCTPSENAEAACHRPVAVQRR